jgi:cysteine desulfurase
MNLATREGSTARRAIAAMSVIYYDASSLQTRAIAHCLPQRCTMTTPVYLDYNATTPVDPAVVEAMLPYLREHFGNASSSHRFGRAAHAGIDRARAQLAALIGAQAAEIVFTGCATESNNLALFGVTRALRDSKRHVVTTAIEHPAVLEPCRRLQEDGWDVSILPVDATGRIELAVLERTVRADTALISIMYANNEIGTIQDIATIARIAHARGAFVHTDAAQTIGKIAVDVRTLGVDLLSIAGHKFYAPKGVGALYVKAGTPIRPAHVGADHEHGLRPGTENVAGIVGLGEAAQLARARLPGITGQLAHHRDRLYEMLREAVPDLALNGHPEHRLPNTLHVSFPGVSGRDLLRAVESEVAASVGSACHSESDAVSGVLAALGLGIGRALGAVRLSVGVYTTDDEVRRAGAALADAWRLLSAGRRAAA